MSKIRQAGSLLLVLAMLVGCMTAFAVTTSAAETETPKDGTLPEGAVVSDTKAKGFSGGDGTKDNPWEIRDVTEFHYFLSYVNESDEHRAESYKQTGDIYYNYKFDPMDATGMPVDLQIPAGITAYPKGKKGGIQGTFSGTYDGGGYGIYNTFVRFGNEGGGLFEKVTGTVKNVNLYGGYLYAGSASAGSIACVLSGGTIQNCYSSVAVFNKASGQSNAGGIVGVVDEAGSKIESTTFEGAITEVGLNAQNSAAGILARAEKSTTVTDCVNRGAIAANSYRMGGIIGFTCNSSQTYTVERCVNYGALTCTGNGATNNGVAGILGFPNADTSGLKAVINYCANYGAITGTATCRTAGIIGGAIGNTKTTAELLGCANYGNVTGLGASGLAVETSGGSFINCYAGGTMQNTGAADSGYAAAQLIGNVKGATTVKNCVGVGDTLYNDANNKVAATNCTLYAAGASAITDGTAVTLLNTGLGTDAWAKGTNAPELKIFMPQPTAVSIPIAAANFSLGGELTMNLLIEKTAIVDADLADTLDTIGVTDGTNVYQASEKEGDLYYVVSIPVDINAFATDKTYQVRYTLKGETEKVLLSPAKKVYSPLQYAINMYDADATTGADLTLNTLLLALVQYADAAETGVKNTFETKTGYNGSYVDNYTEIMEKDKEKTDFTYVTNAASIADLGAALSDGIALTLTMKNTAYTSVTATIENGKGTEDGLTVTAGDGKFLVSGLYANDLYRTITFTFSGDGVDTVTATYSVARFLSNYEGTDSAALAKAAAIYMGAAFDYGVATRA